MRIVSLLVVALVVAGCQQNRGDNPKGDAELEKALIRAWDQNHTDEDGVTYQIGLNKGHVGQLYPKVK